MTNSNWNIRPADGNDLPFIYSTWSKSYRYDSALGKSCKNSIFFPAYNQVQDWILSQNDTQTIVACAPDNSYVVYGYLIYQPGILHYAFTKEIFQRWGIAKSLVEHSGKPEFYTHKTFMVRPIVEKYPSLNFNPFLLFHKGASHGETVECGR